MMAYTMTSQTMASVTVLFHTARNILFQKTIEKTKKIRRYCKLHRHKITTNGVCEVKHDCEGYNVACWQKKMKT